MISMFSMSSGLMSLNREGSAPPTSSELTSAPVEAVLRRTPSTMTSGSLLSETEFEPRMRMREPVPVEPPEDCTVTPEARDERSSEKFVTAARGTLSSVIVVEEFPCSRRRCVSPVAVTTTWSSSIGVDSPGRDGHGAGGRAEADAEHAHLDVARGDVGDAVAPVGRGARADLGADDEDLRVGERLIGAGLDDAARDQPLGGLPLEPARRDRERGQGAEQESEWTMHAFCIPPVRDGGVGLPPRDGIAARRGVKGLSSWRPAPGGRAAG
jgi:hypothetical protein